MVKRAHPEVASSAYAFVVRTHETAGFAYVTVKVQGRNGQNVEALYEMGAMAARRIIDAETDAGAAQSGTTMLAHRLMARETTARRPPPS